MSVPIYVINLRRDTARMSAMVAQLDALGLPFERVDALHGLDLPDWLAAFFLSRAGVSASGLLPGEIGCYASHLAVCAKVFNGGVPALVLEDDVELPADLPELLARLTAGQQDWDIIRLSNRNKRPVRHVRRVTSQYSLIKYARVPPSTGAYLISPEGARKFLTWKVVRDLPVDQDLRRTWDCGLRSYGVWPVPIDPDCGVSSIDAMHQRPNVKLRKMFGVCDYVRRSWYEIQWLGLAFWLGSRVQWRRFRFQRLRPRRYAVDANDTAPKITTIPVNV